jgi:DNA-binding HxlR family transcriptional regulator
LDGVSHKVLTDAPRSAERDGLIFRRVDSERTDTTTLYELTDLGKTLEAPLAGLEQWVGTNWHLVEGPGETGWLEPRGNRLFVAAIQFREPL